MTPELRATPAHSRASEIRASRVCRIVVSAATDGGGGGQFVESQACANVASVGMFEQLLNGTSRASTMPTIIMPALLESIKVQSVSLECQTAAGCADDARTEYVRATPADAMRACSIDGINNYGVQPIDLLS